MPERFVLRSQALLSVFMTILVALIATHPADHSTQLAIYDVAAISGALITGLCLFMLFFLWSVVKNGPQGLMVVTQGVLEAYFCIVAGAGIALESIPAWLAHAYTAAILTFLFGLVITNLASLMAFCWYSTTNGSWWEKRMYWKFSVFHALLPVAALSTIAFFAAGGAVPTLRSPLIDIAPLLVPAGILFAQFVWAGRLDRPFQQRLKLEVVSGREAA